MMVGSADNHNDTQCVMVGSDDHHILKLGGRLMHLESGKLSPAFWMSLWRPVEAADGAAGGCSSTSPLPTLRESMMPGAHTRAQCSAHVSHFFAVAFDMFMVCECRFAHASALDS